MTNKPVKFKIDIDSTITSFVFSDKKLIKIKISKALLKKRIAFVLSMLTEHNAELACKFSDDAEIESLNSTYRKKNKPTDVLSFVPSLHFKYREAGNGNARSMVFWGDIIISLPTCYIQAKKYKNTFSFELEKMLIHGIVHLLGLDHERNDSAKKIQENLERSIMSELVKHLGDPLWISQSC